MALILFIPFLVVQSVYSGDITQFEPSEKPINVNVTYEEAIDHCELLPGGRLPDDSVDSTSLMAMMRQKKVSSVWMGINMASLGNWTWTDGEQDTTLGPNQGIGGRVCAGISTVPRNIQPKSCNYGSNLEGVVCQHEADLEECSRKGHQWHCFEVGSVVYSFKCGVDNWYDARQKCKPLNASIGILNTTAKIEGFVKAKNKIPSLSLCNFFWVGLRKEEWMVQHKDEGKRGLEMVRWRRQEPRYGPHCVTFEIISATYGWKTMSCSERHAVICIILKQEVTPNTENVTVSAGVNLPSDPAPERYVVYIGLGLSISIIAVFLIIICLVWRRRRVKREREAK